MSTGSSHRAVRFSDSELRRLAGGDRSIRRGPRHDDSRAALYKCPLSALNHEERHLMHKRHQLKAQAGPSVCSATASTVSQAANVDELIAEIMSNSSRAIVLDETVYSSGFNDARAAALASALRHNRSIVAITLRAVNITEIGLCSICESLKRNRGVRALEIQFVGLTPKSMRAILSLVSTNSHVVHVSLVRTGADEDPIALQIEEAVHMNRMLLADPKVNQYENWLFAVDAASAASGDRGALETSAYAWDAEDSDREGEDMLQAEAHAFASSSGKIARPVCNHYLQGACTYGSRCRHYHPDRLVSDESELVLGGGGRTSALQPAPALEEEPLFTMPQTQPLVQALLLERDRSSAARWTQVFNWTALAIAVAALTAASAMQVRQRASPPG